MVSAEFLRYFRAGYFNVSLWLRLFCCFLVLHKKLLNPHSASISQSTYYKRAMAIS